MLDTTTRYVFEVYRLKSVSAAAKALFISQPALSAAIQKAEKELGAPIFNRKTLPFTLTAEGKIYMEAIEKMLALEAQTADRIRDIREIRGGTLRIATSTHISFYAIPKILEQFHQTYPQVDVNIIVTDTDKLYPMLDKEMADLVFISAETIPNDYEEAVLFQEQLVIAIPSENPICKDLTAFAVTHEDLVGGSYPPDKKITDMSVFRGTEFIYSPPNTNIQKKRKLLFGKSDFTPYVTYNAGRQQLNYNLMLAGFGAFLTTDANIATMPPSANCTYFVLGGPASGPNFSIVWSSKEEYDAVSARQAFIEHAIRYYNDPQPLKKLLR